jgi:hypothetical protein
LPSANAFGLHPFTSSLALSSPFSSSSSSSYIANSFYMHHACCCSTGRKKEGAPQGYA